MCRKMRNNFVIAFSYVSVIAIGVLIYLVVFLFAEKRQSASKSQIRDFITFPQIPKKVAESSAESNSDSAKNGVDSAISINELPNEIDSALNVLEKPTDSANSTKIAESSEIVEIFPRDFIVDAKIINVRASANTNAKIIKRFKEGAIISIRKIEGQWAQLANGGFVFAPLLKEMPKKEIKKTPAKEAKKAKDSAKNQVKKSAESSKKSKDSAKSQNLAPKSQNLPKKPTDSAPKSQNLPAKNPTK